MQCTLSNSLVPCQQEHPLSQIAQASQERTLSETDSVAIIFVCESAEV